VLSEAHGQKIAVIENEFGEENIDNEILCRISKKQIIQLNNGCVCLARSARICARRSPTWPRKREGELDFDRVRIGRPALADPAGRANFFMGRQIAEQ